MPHVHNRTAQELNLRTGQVIEPNADLEVTAEEAAELKDSPLLDVHLDDSCPAPTTSSEPASQPAAESTSLAEAQAEMAKAQADLEAAQQAAGNQESN